MSRHLFSIYDDIDVLEKNSFGRGSVTEAFQSEDTDMGTLEVSKGPTVY